MPFQLSSNIIGHFKIGDNIVYNLSILADLYGADNPLFVKPLIVICASISEAVLYDLLVNRIRRYTFENIDRIADDVTERIRNTTRDPDSFKKYIDICRAHNLLRTGGSDIYDSLHGLRKLRNRIHIQNTQDEGVNDEEREFVVGKLVVAEQVTERLLRTLIYDFTRAEGYRDFVNRGVFDFPWNPHYEDDPAFQ